MYAVGVTLPYDLALTHRPVENHIEQAWRTQEDIQTEAWELPSQDNFGSVVKSWGYGLYFMGRE